MKKNKSIKYKLNIYYIILFITILSISIGFSTFQNKLTIQNIITSVRIDKDVRIMGISINSVNDAISNYEEYNINNITSSIELQNENSYIIYDIDIYNLGNVDVAISNITNNNENLNVELLNYTIGDKICEDSVCNLGVKKKIQVKISYKDGKYDSSNTTQEIKLDFTFGIVYNISYIGIENTESLPIYAVEGTTFTASITIDSSKNLSITMNSKTLIKDTSYTYSNNLLSIENVNGDIIIKISEMTTMKSKVITSFIDSGNEEEIEEYDLDTMSSDDKTSNFSNIATESGLYRTKGITGTNNVLIYRGNVTNNYVSFAGTLWRILQVDEDGNLRLITNNIISTKSAYNTTSTISSIDEVQTILGYSNSSIKSILDTWYESLSDYSEYIIDSKFCNDFTYKTITSSGAGTETYYYQSYLNVGVDSALYSPSLVCPSDSIITEKIGLASAEEVVLAGGAYNKSSTSYYLYNSSSWWTLSPAYYDESQANGGVFFVNSSGSLTDWSNSLLTASYGLRPVITINGNLELTGDGTLSNPYKLTSEEANTITKVNITDLTTLSTGKYYITNTGGLYDVDGLLSSTTSGIGLVGTNTATFSSDKETIISTSGTLFSFINGQETTDGYLYQIITDDNKYLTIGATDYTVTLSDTPVYLKVSLCTDTNYSGRIIISDETGAMYLNFYGASNTSDDKFAGWNELDKNDYMILYKEA